MFCMFRFLSNPEADLQMKQWATEGLAYLTLDADVKEDLVHDPKALESVILAAKVCINEFIVSYPPPLL